MQLTITGYSTALFATWYFVEELGILFDAGDGVAAGLTQKSGKVRDIFISHADRDHLTGLLQFNQLNARPGGVPRIFYPADSGSFPALQAFSVSFDAQVARTSWQGVRPSDELTISKEWLVKPIVNGHVSTAGSLIKSLSYLVYHVKHKLRPAYAGMDGMAIGRLRKELGNEAVMEEVREPVIGYSGDTPVEDLQRWQGVQTLIHEATFLEKQAMDDRPNKHSTLPEVLEMVAGMHIGRLILGHFSRRYDHADILHAVMEQCRRYAIRCPVYVVLPGELHRDILQGEPCWKGR